MEAIEEGTFSLSVCLPERLGSFHLKAIAFPCVDIFILATSLTFQSAGLLYHS